MAANCSRQEPKSKTTRETARGDDKYMRERSHIGCDTVALFCQLFFIIFLVFDGPGPPLVETRDDHSYTALDSLT